MIKIIKLKLKNLESLKAFSKKKKILCSKMPIKTAKNF